MRTLFLASCLLLVARPLPAADWVSVGTDGDIEHFVDRETLQRTQEIVRVAKRAVYRDPHPIGDTPGLPLMKETVGIVECDCLRFQHRAVSLQLIGLDGAVLHSTGEMKRVWETIDPGSPGRATLDFACAATAH
ncbi:MAG: hypothetical protein U1F52_09740 [Burkholderiales bacterium]